MCGAISCGHANDSRPIVTAEFSVKLRATRFEFNTGTNRLSNGSIKPAILSPVSTNKVGYVRKVYWGTGDRDSDDLKREKN